MSVRTKEPCPPVTTDIDVLSHADDKESPVDGQILVHLHCWVIDVLIPLQVCVTFAVAVCNQFALFLLIYTTEECADSAVFANWQFCESQDHISSVMSHVAPTRNLLMLNSLFILSRPLSPQSCDTL